MPKETKHFEVKDYEKHGVHVCVSIDYDNEHISIVEQQKGSIPIQYKTKEWRFAHRELAYMHGWQNIFEAMAYAVEQATKSLKQHVEAKERAQAALQKKVIGTVVGHTLKRK